MSIHVLLTFLNELSSRDIKQGLLSIYCFFINSIIQEHEH